MGIKDVFTHVVKILYADGRVGVVRCRYATKHIHTGDGWKYDRATGAGLKGNKDSRLLLDSIKMVNR